MLRTSSRLGILSMVALLLTMPWLSACGNGGETPAATVTATTTPTETSTEAPITKPPAAPEGRLTIAFTLIHTSPELGPFNRAAPVTRTFWSLMADYLVYEKSDDSGYVPGLAEEWEVASDNMSITFKLRQGVQFHEGWGELTSEDVKFTLDTTLDPSLGGEWGNIQTSLGPLVDRVETSGPYEVTIHCTKPIADEILHFMAPSNTMGLGVLSKAYYDEVGIRAGNRHPIFSGPYKLVEYSLGDQLALEAVDDHWRVVPEFKEIIFKEVPELMTRVAMLETGEADIAEVTTEQAMFLQGDDFEIVAIPDAEYTGLTLWGQWLPERESYDPELPWLDKRVREAMNLAIDRETIAEELYHGMASPVADIVDMPFGEPREPYPYDIERARQLMAEAGYPDGFGADMWIYPFSGKTDPTDLLLTVASYWGKIGIDLDISSYIVTAVYGDIVTRKVSGVCGPFQTDKATQPYYLISTAWASSAAGASFPLYESAQADAIIEEYLAANTAQAMEAAFARLAQYLYDEYVFVPLLSVDKTYVARANTIANWEPTVLQYLKLEYATHPEPLGTFRLFEP